jgi:hypothetical protein
MLALVLGSFHAASNARSSVEYMAGTYLRQQHRVSKSAGFPRIYLGIPPVTRPLQGRPGPSPLQL